MSLDIQFQLMIHVTLYGMFVGITYDCFRMFKEGFKNIFVQYFIILVFWLIQIPLAFVFIYQVNEGIFHLYILIFLLLGALCYFKFMRQNLRDDLENLGISIFVILNFIKKLVIILVISPILFIYKLLSDIIKMFLRVLEVIFYIPFVKLIKWVSCKKKVKRRGKKTSSGDGQQS
ncbi:MAG: spore cortex biosynthesis protein YabQ [Turicibacter sp.]